MDEKDFEGTLVLEKLASISLVDNFFEAIDSDDISRVVQIMKKAKIDSETISTVVEMIKDGE